MNSKHGLKKLTTYQKARLQVVAYRAIQSAITDFLGQHELNTAQWIILGWLYDNPNGMRITAIAETLEVETPLITALMQPLQVSKLVSLKADATDRRAKLASLTDGGVDLVSRLEPALESQLQIFDKSIRRNEMDSYYNVLQNLIYVSNRRGK